jgi:hypothetical protein
MYKIFSASLLLFCLGFLFSCNKPNKALDLQKQSEVLHDEAMKDLGIMNRISKNLRKELAQLDSLHQTSPRRDSIQQAVAAMREAEDGMMIWMAQYKAVEQVPEKEALPFMTKQKNDIEKNRNDIKEALQRGKALAH